MGPRVLHGWPVAHRRMWRGIASRGRSPRKQEEPLKSARRKAKAKENASNASCAEGFDTPRGCAPAEDGLLTWSRTRQKEKTPMKTACWTEEDDETLQLGHLGSEPCPMSSPPGLSDAFSEAGWTVVTRKSRNRQQCSRRRWCLDNRVAQLSGHCRTVTTT